MNIDPKIIEVANSIPGRLMFLALVGSRGSGYSRPSSDYDIHGVYMPTTDALLGIDRFPGGKEKTCYDPSVTRTSDGLGIDASFWTFTRFLGLVWSGAPNVFPTLFSSDMNTLFCEPDFKWFVDHKRLFIRKSTIRAFLGFASGCLQGARRAVAWKADPKMSHVPNEALYRRQAVHLHRAVYQACSLTIRQDVTLTPDNIQTLCKIRDHGILISELEEFYQENQTSIQRLVEDMPNENHEKENLERVRLEIRDVLYGEFKPIKIKSRTCSRGRSVVGP